MAQIAMKARPRSMLDQFGVGDTRLVGARNKDLSFGTDRLRWMPPSAPSARHNGFRRPGGRNDGVFAKGGVFIGSNGAGAGAGPSIVL